MSRVCNACVSNEKLKETDPAKYEEFKASQGSAPTMEKDDTVKDF